MFKREPLPHQLECLNRSIGENNFAFLIDMGGGKTKVTIDTVNILFSQGKINRWLCIAPNGIYKNWLRELELDLLDSISHRIKIWKQEEIITKVSDTKNFLNILLMNIEAFSSKKGLEYAKKFITENTIVTVDESTTIKNHKAKRALALTEISRIAKYRRILTGYPTPQNQLDLFMQFNFLDWRIIGLRSFYAFQNEYGIVKKIDLGPGRPKFNKIIGCANIDNLKEKIKPYSFIIRKDECLNLPEKIYQIREVQMSNEQIRVYNEIRDKAVSILQDQSLVTVDMVLTQLVKLHQITCGYIKNEEDSIYLFEKNPKLEALLDAIEQTSDKIIIWSPYVITIKFIEEKLKNIFGEKYVHTYFGETRQKEREKALHEFQFGEAKAFIGNPSTAGFGLTLTASSTVFYYANSYNLEHRLQSEDRCHRIGQKKSVVYTDLLCNKTVDVKILKALKSKKSIGSIILDEEWKEWII